MQKWALEIFSIIPYITFKCIKGNDNVTIMVIQGIQVKMIN